MEIQRSERSWNFFAYRDAEDVKQSVNVEAPFTLEIFVAGLLLGRYCTEVICERNRCACTRFLDAYY